MFNKGGTIFDRIISQSCYNCVYCYEKYLGYDLLKCDGDFLINNVDSNELVYCHLILDEFTKCGWPICPHFEKKIGIIESILLFISKKLTLMQIKQFLKQETLNDKNRKI